MALRSFSRRAAGTTPAITINQILSLTGDHILPICISKQNDEYLSGDVELDVARRIKKANSVFAVMLKISKRN